MIAMPNPEEDYSFNLEHILANPPVMAAFALLCVPKKVIAQVSGYSKSMVSGWISGKKQLTPAQAKRLIDFAIAIMNNLNANGDMTSLLPRPAREKLAFRLRAAHALVALQRYISLGDDFCAQDEAFWQENMMVNEVRRKKR